MTGLLGAFGTSVCWIAGMNVTVPWLAAPAAVPPVRSFHDHCHVSAASVTRMSNGIDDPGVGSAASGSATSTPLRSRARAGTRDFPLGRDRADAVAFVPVGAGPPAEVQRAFWRPAPARSLLAGRIRRRGRPV